MLSSPWQEFLRIGLLALLAGNVLAVIVGVVLIVTPRRLAAWSELTDRWVSTQPVASRLDQMRNVDAYALKYPRLLGALLLVGAAFLLVYGALLVERVGTYTGARVLAELFGVGALPMALWEVLWVCLLVLLLLGGVLALVVGGLALAAPPLLQRFSDAANRWVETGRGEQALDTPRYGFDASVRRQPRLWGVIITLLAGYTLGVLLWLWRLL